LIAIHLLPKNTSPGLLTEDPKSSTKLDVLSKLQSCKRRTEPRP